MRQTGSGQRRPEPPHDELRVNGSFWKQAALAVWMAGRRPCQWAAIRRRPVVVEPGQSPRRVPMPLQTPQNACVPHAHRAGMRQPNERTLGGAAKHLLRGRSPITSWRAEGANFPCADGQTPPPIQMQSRSPGHQLRAATAGSAVSFSVFIIIRRPSSELVVPLAGHMCPRRVLRVRQTLWYGLLLRRVVCRVRHSFCVCT